MRQFSTTYQNRLAGEAVEKDALLKYLADYIKQISLTAAGLQLLSPGIHRNKLSLLRDEDRSAGSIHLLRSIAAAIESGGLENESAKPSTGRGEQKDHDRDPVAEAVKEELQRTVARRVRLMPTPEFTALLPNIGKRQLTDLRNEKPGFGWDRLNTIAVRLNIDVAGIWSKHYQPAQVAA